MKRFLFAVVCAALFANAAPAADLPRPAGKLDAVLPTGGKLDISNYRGKVLVVEFLFTTCPHCQQTSTILSKLNQQLGPRGFQPIGVAFNEGAMMLVPQFVKDFRVNYPVGVAGRDAVLNFLGYSPMARLMVPQVVFIDRKGNVRFQSSIDGSENLHDEARMRAHIEQLLAEPAVTKSAAASSKKK